MTDQPTDDPIGETTPETAHALLWRHGLPENVIDGALALHAQELAETIRAAADRPRKADESAMGQSLRRTRYRAAADLIDPTTGATQPAVPVSSPPPDQTALRDRIAEALAPYFANFSDWDTARINAGEAAAAVLAVLPPPADRAAVLLEADWIVEHCPEHGCVEPETEVCHCEIADRLRRLAAEAPQPETPNVDRAAVYREVADRLTTDAHGMQPDWARIYKRDAAVKVREWADRLDGERQDGPETRP